MSVGQNTVAGDQLRSFVERIEHVMQEKKDLSADQAAIFAEAKAAGFTAKVIRAVIKARSMKPHDRQEMEALFDLYMHALGMDDAPPLFRAAGLMNVDTAARDMVIEALKLLAPQSGDIVVRMGADPVRLWRDKDGEVHVESWSPVESEQPGAPKARPGRAPKMPKGEVPDVDDAGAVELGRQYARDNRPVIDNPFPFGDKRRPRFDEGWRAETGGDGMGPKD